MTINDAGSGAGDNSFIPHNNSRNPQATVKSPCIQEPLAVIGLACRLPGENPNPTALWRFLERGGIANNTPPASRFNIKGHHDGSFKPKTTASPGGMFVEGIDPHDIDAQFFKLSKVEAISMDPQQRQLLEVVYEGMENAGLTLEGLDSKKFGCFVGSFASDYGDIQARDPEDRAPASSIGIGRAMLSNRISHFLNIKGPSMTIDTACSGSLIGLDVANRYLQTREIDGAIIAGCNLYLSPEHVMDHVAYGGTASASGRCHTFDAKADGYIKAEAINMVIVKRLQDAIRDRDPIRAVMRGSANNSDGWTAGIASPSSEAQAAAIHQAYLNAGISDYGATSYLECHGTGTRAGDVIEVNGVASVFSTYRTRDNPLHIGSIKSNIGHSEPAAGISGLLKTILALEKGIIPGNPTFIEPNPKLDFNVLRLRPSRLTIPWPNVPFRRAGVSSYGYGGSNAHVILDEAAGFLQRDITSHVSSFTLNVDDLFAEDEISERPYVIVLSANDSSSLESYLKSLDKHLADPRVSLKLRDIAFTLSERRSRHFHRGYILSKSSSLSRATLVVGKTLPKAPSIGFVFTGQGAQWSEMGQGILSNFPLARSMIQHLDRVLQCLPDGPKWSLFSELTEPRSAEHLRQPVFSQPLVTALQLAVIAVLKSWGVECHSVVGHSSGEIAAAVAAGHLTNEEAIKVAYYRGLAALEYKSPAPVGMLAVGLGEDGVQKYLRHIEKVEIACINSPESVTLSGELAQLNSLILTLKEDGYFARLLLVDLAYHSSFMKDIAARYKELLDQNSALPSVLASTARMFSSVTGKMLDGVCNITYWRDNMASPVLFSQATQAMLSQLDSPDILLEIGPSAALSGPIKQIKRVITKNSQGAGHYFSALKRGDKSISTMMDLAGQLFILGSPINLIEVNCDGNPDDPSIIVDLPNYSWNHSTKYWHESQASKDWRMRRFVHHDLLGSKILGAPWDSPSFKKTLRLKDLPWLKDHRLGESIIFPASGYIAMAIEALFQKSKAIGRVSEETEIHQVSWLFRNVTFTKALVLDEDADTSMMLSLNVYHGHKDSWHEFKILSATDEGTNEHCHGLMRITKNSIPAANESDLRPLQHSTPASTWYKAMSDAGYSFGKRFQTQVAVESTSGARKNRSLVSFDQPESAHPQSPYPMHPASIDGCFQTAGAAIWKGDRSSVNAVLVPAMIDECSVYSRPTQPKTGISIASAEVGRAGRLEDPTSYKSHASVYDTETGIPLFQMKGFRYSALNTRKNIHDSHSYTRLAWKPDISLLTRSQLSEYLSRKQETDPEKLNHSVNRAGEIIDLMLHKNPALKVIELNLTGRPESDWLDHYQLDPLSHVASQGSKIFLSTNEALLQAQEKYGGIGKVQYRLFESNVLLVEEKSEETLDFIILHISLSGIANLNSVLDFTQRKISDSGSLMILDDGVGDIGSMLIPAEDSSGALGGETTVTELLHLAGLQQQWSNIPTCVKSPRPGSSSVILATRYPMTSAKDVTINIVHFLKEDQATHSIADSLVSSGWSVHHHYLPFTNLQPAAITLVVEDMSSTLLSSMDLQNWDALKHLFSQERRVLWVTTGSQMKVTNPNGALINGLMRTVRAEYPSLDLVSLDVECIKRNVTISSIELILRRMKFSVLTQQTEAEYVERNSSLYISRVLPDVPLNQAEKDHTYGAGAILRPLHELKTCVRLISTQPGSLDALAYAEISEKEIPLPDGFGEVDIYAASLNFKDVAIAMGLFKANEHLLGLEGGGVIRRLGRNTGSLKVGQRVVVSRKGSFANRVQCPVEAIYPLPDWMSYEEASTLPAVYFVCLYGLIDLANTQKGQTVLIHSAAGGVGIAAIQVCTYLGAEIYATVGTDEKRKFLVDTFGLAPDHIFTSRSTAFGAALMNATSGKGVDVILNSLSDELLDESWRCIADNGIFVEIGKKDMEARSNLSMEPFCRNASYRAIDISLDSFPLATIARLLSQTFKLIEEGHIKPIEPRTVFSFTDIVDAFRYMRSGNHIGKIIVTSSSSRSEEVRIRPATPTVRLRSDASYLIVGGLKGLCGSLAIYLGHIGAGELVIMSRSGCDDELSQSVLFQLKALGTEVTVIKGDVSKCEDVQRAFKQAAKPIAGIVQGAMLLRDKMFAFMTATEFNESIKPKLEGTWNIHNVAQEQGLAMDFFIMLSSICGVVGQTGQANYSAANAFLDAFSAYRRRLGLCACSIDLGVIEDVGYVSTNEMVAKRLNLQGWTPINEGLLHKIIRFSILQQASSPINPTSTTQMITGIPIPLHLESSLFREGILLDDRFSRLSFSSSEAVSTDRHESLRDVRALLSLVKSKAQADTILANVVQVVNRQLMKSLGMTESIEPSKPLSGYGIDSLVAVEFRNWVQQQLGVDVTTIEVINAKTLKTLCERIVAKILVP